MPALRSRATEATLEELTKARWIDEDTRQELTEAYWFLRNVEHRIQMVRDEQTHLLPETDTELKRIAFMMGFSDTQSFAEALVAILKTVERRYARLFEQEAKLSSKAGNLVFTGQNDDPETLETLSKLGFERPSDISRVIRTWHYGRYRATRSVEARERLDFFKVLSPPVLRDLIILCRRRASILCKRFLKPVAGMILQL